ncbi:MAG: response regulator [Deltaproteobacteria bacterium]|nr:response regulator [Deltaproteobacteria bacterium]
MNRESILIVEDEPDMLDLIDFNMTRRGYVTAGSLDGIDALKKIRHFKPDLIILDLMLPEMDGWEICRYMRQQNINCRILMLTAKAMSEDRLQGFEIGADDYMTKPFNVKELMVRVERLLKRNEGAAAMNV